MPNGSDKVTVTPLPAYKSDKSVTVRGDTYGVVECTHCVYIRTRT